MQGGPNLCTDIHRSSLIGKTAKLMVSPEHGSERGGQGELGLTERVSRQGTYVQALPTLLNPVECISWLPRNIDSLVLEISAQISPDPPVMLVCPSIVISSN